MPSFPLVVQPLVHRFRRCFTAPGFGPFVRLLSGWMLLRGGHTLSRVLQASSVLAGRRHQAAFYRFFSEGRGVLDEVALRLGAAGPLSPLPRQGKRRAHRAASAVASGVLRSRSTFRIGARMSFRDGQVR